jgi:hypothetical protein
MSSKSDIEYTELVTAIMALPEAVRSVKLLTTAKAALFLQSSTSTLERRRKSHEPPPPAPNFAGGRKGDDVMYLASTLVEFIRGEAITQPNPYPEAQPSVLAVNAAAARRNALSATGARRHLAKYGAGPTVEDEAAYMPFFIGLGGMVLSPCWDEPAAMLDLFLDDTTDVVWKAWPDALAAVWQYEPVRQDWLKTADQFALGLRERAEAIRHARLSSI